MWSRLTTSIIESYLCSASFPPYKSKVSWKSAENICRAISWKPSLSTSKLSTSPPPRRSVCWDLQAQLVQLAQLITPPWYRALITVPQTDHWARARYILYRAKTLNCRHAITPNKNSTKTTVVNSSLVHPAQVSCVSCASTALCHCCSLPTSSATT